ncbi:hypothetical protein [Alkalibaculum sporogenes]|uniref:hypothetical protein n=1 Tax=Alkalibaculum sporogenes TaxID=2655001 RepID=UPI00187BB546|nr:hypothetical protein [Alkalibaculum sporogenes]
MMYICPFESLLSLSIKNYNNNSDYNFDAIVLKGRGYHICNSFYDFVMYHDTDKEL